MIHVLYEPYRKVKYKMKSSYDIFASDRKSTIIHSIINGPSKYINLYTEKVCKYNMIDQLAFRTKRLITMQFIITTYVS